MIALGIRFRNRRRGDAKGKRLGSFPSVQAATAAFKNLKLLEPLSKREGVIDPMVGASVPKRSRHPTLDEVRACFVAKPLRGPTLPGTTRLDFRSA
jgi:hypothetical protein